MRVRRILLIGVNVVLLTAFAFLWNRPEPLDPSAGPDRKPISIPLLPPFPESLHGELDRALFRTNLPPHADDETQGGGPEPVMRLVGVVLTGEQKIAMVEFAGTVTRVEEGADLEGWQVTRIEARTIQLANAERQIELPLDVPAEP